MKKKQRKYIKYNNVDYTKCLVCERKLMKKELHHFPIPHIHGGEMVVPTCIPCHDMIDRYSLDSLNEDIDGYSIDGLMGCSKLAIDFLFSFGALLNPKKFEPKVDNFLPNWYEINIEPMKGDDCEKRAFEIIEDCTTEGKCFIMKIISLFYEHESKNIYT